MLRLLADENLDANIVRGLLRRVSALDLINVQEAGLSGADDPTVLQWAAEHGRVVVTHDVATMTRYANDRITRGLRMPGLVEVVSGTSVGGAIVDLELLVLACVDDDMDGQVVYVPLSR